MGAENALRCFHVLLTGIETEEAKAVDQANAWAQGDLKALKDSYVAPANCSAEVAGDQQKRTSAAEDWFKLLTGALERSDQTFAMIDVESVLRPNGVLARLEAAGAKVDVPESAKTLAQ